MTTLKGTGSIDVNTFRAQSTALTKEYEIQDRTIKAAERARRGELPETPVKSGAAPKSAAAQLMEKEAAFGKGAIDWSRFEALRSATPRALEDAFQKFRALDRLDLDFQKLVQSFAYLGTGIELEKLPTADARRHYADRVATLGLIETVKRGLVAAGDCPATAHFPHDQLALLERAIKDDMAALVQVKGDSVKQAEPEKPRWGGGWGWGAVEQDPSPDMLPASTAVSKAHVETLEAASRAIAERLGAPDLVATIETVAAKLDGANKEAFTKLLGAYAILADEAVHAPDYAKDPGRQGPDHRQRYRAREHSGGWGAHLDKKRQTESKHTLAAPLRALPNAADAVDALGKTLVKETLREIGVESWRAAHWNAKPEAVRAMLEGEGFLPLRALNERAHHHSVKSHEGEMRAVVLEITRSVVEGRFEEWRASHPASDAQLALLTDAQRKVWLEGVSTTHEVKTKDGKVVTFTTSEPRDMERFWATKVGGPSHGFDTMTQCVVPLLTNARNDTIVVSDPRWPNHAGRTYLRLVQLAKTEEPVLFLESSHKDFPYPGSKLETESAIVKHAIAKAKKMGIPLVLSGRNEQTIKHLGLKGDWKDEAYRLAPSLLYEAASVFGPHDWVQKQPEVRGASSIQFFVDLGA